MEVIAFMRAAILAHPRTLIQVPVLRLLRRLSKRYGDVDVRDRARTYLNMVTYFDVEALQDILESPRVEDNCIEEENFKLAKPGKVQRVDPRRFLNLVPYPHVRNEAGLMDGGSVDFLSTGKACDDPGVIHIPLRLSFLDKGDWKDFPSRLYSILIEIESSADVEEAVRTAPG